MKPRSDDPRTKELRARRRPALRSPGTRLRVLAAALVLGLALAPVSTARIVAVADIHGDYDAFVGILQEAGLLSEDLTWSGGDATLVQTGDVLDRGLEVVPLIELLQRLSEEASAAGGEVVLLMGNHEAMNALGITRDVNPDLYERFATASSEERREDAYRDYRDWHKQRTKELKRRKSDRRTKPMDRDEWMALHPPGYLEYEDEIGPEGAIGEWIRTLAGAAVRRGVLFLHGGISEPLRGVTVEDINGRVIEEIERFDRCRAELIERGVVHWTADTSQVASEGLAEVDWLNTRLNQPDLAPEAIEDASEGLRVLGDCTNYQDWYLISEEGPLWYRGYARLEEEEGLGLVARTLEDFGVHHIAVGHSPRRDARIQARFGERVFLMDTGMLSSYYRGRAAALEFDRGVFSAIYEDGKVELSSHHDASDLEFEALPEAESVTSDEVIYYNWRGEELPFLDDSEVETFLREGELINREEIDTGINRPWRVQLRYNGVEAGAIFRTVDQQLDDYRTPRGEYFPVFRDSYRYEVAAYRLDRLLGFKRVPAAVLRRLEGRDGSMQMWIERATTEQGRRDEGLEPPDPVEWTRDRLRRDLFDALIFNTDRNLGNILIQRSDWRVWWIDHTRSFVMRDEVPDIESIQQCDRRIFERLQAITDEQLTQTLEDVLTTWEIEHLLQRRKRLVEHLQKKILDQGAEAVLFAPASSGASG